MGRVVELVSRAGAVSPMVKWAWRWVVIWADVMPAQGPSVLVRPHRDRRLEYVSEKAPVKHTSRKPDTLAAGMRRAARAALPTTPHVPVPALGRSRTMPPALKVMYTRSRMSRMGWALKFTEGPLPAPGVHEGYRALITEK